MTLIFVVLSLLFTGMLFGTAAAIGWFVGFLTMVYVFGRSNAKNLTLDQTFNPGWVIFAKRKVECDE